MAVFLLIMLIMVFIMCFSLIIALNKADKRNNTKNAEHAKKTNYNVYYKKPLLTKNEFTFYNKFIELENELDIKIVPQVNLATIVQKIDATQHFHTELFRNIDFGIFNSDYSEVLLLIELNDSSHNSKSRKYRDNRVHEICNSAGIRLIKFYTPYPNEKEYVKKRIKDNLFKKVA